MSNLTERVAINGGGIKFKRIMAGEYVAVIGSYRYEIDFIERGCSECTHVHEYWKLAIGRMRPLSGTFYYEEPTKHRTLTDARIAATKYYEEHP